MTLEYGKHGVSLARGTMAVAGAFLACQFAFNKAFSYLHVRVGPVPVFVTEAMLALLVLMVAFALVRYRNGVIPNDPLFFIFVGMFFLIGTGHLASIAFGDRADAIQSMKRAVLFAYAGFAVAIYLLGRERVALESFFRLAFWGAAAASGFAFLARFNLLPGWWPVSVGIAECWALVFVLCTGLFGVGDGSAPRLKSALAGLAASLLLTTSIRSVLVVVSVVSVIGVLVLVMNRPLRPERRQFGYFTLAAITGVIVLVAPARRVPVAIQRMVAVGEIGESEPAKVVYQDRSSARPSSVQTSNVTFEPDEGHLIEPRDEKWLRELYWPFTRLAVLDIHLADRPHGGNLLWRMRVWFEGFKQTVRRHPWFGHGWSEATVMESVTPYGNAERREQAISLLKARYSFSNRLSGAAPTADVNPEIKMLLTRTEGERFHSPYWYDIDFHNSHLAVFYRLGAVGLAGYVGLLALLFVRLFRRVFDGEPLALTLLLFLTFAVGTSTFNVVLEGPFMGSVFWCLVGAGFAGSANRHIPSPARPEPTAGVLTTPPSGESN